MMEFDLLRLVAGVILSHIIYSMWQQSLAKSVPWLVFLIVIAWFTVMNVSLCNSSLEICYDTSPNSDHWWDR